MGAQSDEVLRVPQRAARPTYSSGDDQLRALLLAGPAELRERLRGLTSGALINACAGLRPTTDLGDPIQATKAALRRLARRHQQLTAARELDEELAPLVTTAAPRLLAPARRRRRGRRATAGQRRGQPGPPQLRSRLRIPASSGCTDRHPLNRGRDRAANNALHTIALTRMRWDPRTRAYMARRRQQCLPNPRRCAA